MTLQPQPGAQAAVPNNQIATVNGGASYSYDPSGNLTSDLAHNYKYDAESRLVTVDANTASSVYDSSNRRVKKTAGGITTHYLWEGSQVIAEYDDTGALISEYVFAGSRMVAREQGGGLVYFLQDRLSTRLITDSAGNIVGREDHLPFGEDAGTGSGQSEKYRFTSYERDSESGSDYALNRQYSNSTGRFNRPDPFDGSYDFGNPQSLNRYAYVDNDPTNMVDPFGLVRICLPSLVNPGCWVCQEDDGSLTVDCHQRDVVTLDPRPGPFFPPDRPDRPKPRRVKTPCSDYFPPTNPVAYLRSLQGGSGPTPPPPPQSEEASLHVSVGAGPVSIGMIFNSDSTVMATAGVAWSTPFSGSITGSNSVTTEGLYLQGGAFFGLGGVLSINPFNPKQSSGEGGFGIPSASVGTSMVFQIFPPAPQTESDKRRLRENKLTTGVGRCPY